MKHSCVALTVLGFATVSPVALGGGENTAAGGATTQRANDFMEMDFQKSMKMDEPMPTGMAKPGMKKGDVKANVEKKEPKLEEMMREDMK